MKASVGGDKLALAVTADGRFEIYDFDNATGIVSNPIALNSTDYARAYGVEFSPDGNLLYGTKNVAPSNIFQWNLNAGGAAAIQASSTIIGTSGSNSIGALQLGPDAKIYLARFNSARLGVINTPNNLGVSANFEDNGPVLGGRVSRS